MKFESAFFNKIRMRDPVGDAPPERMCEAEGCTSAGEYRAPKGRDAEGQYFWFCLDHVRAYNRAYNYFSGMNDSAVQAFQKASMTGHRPTWRVGVGTARFDARAGFVWSDHLDDAFDLLHDSYRPHRPAAEPRRSIHNMERKSLRTLGLDETASPAEVKARYKLLVKRHHPDANGGDRSLEERLRQIIQAYTYLKSVGFC
jgi:curved DNA-binding protein CbpA